MDPDRVRAYLQISCAGLGFDIGELWWTCNKDEDCNSSLVAIDEKKDATSNTTACTSGNSGKKLRFEQLYTSKSYANRRSMLVRPSDEEENNAQVHGSNTEDSTSDLEKHVLSPTLVDAISITAQVVWAHTKKVEGLTGRSDIRLQTAVGMPVAIDKNGNMCVVVMYSPNNISSTDDALEYLQSICRSATSTSIPALLPAFDPKRGLISLPNHHHLSESEKLPLLSNVLSEGVSTRFVPLDENHADKDQPLSLPEVHSDHDLENAPRDCFGIPMLPSIAEIGSSSKREDSNNVTTSDVFDEASYGVWSTIMLQAVNTIESIDVMEEQENGIPSQYVSKEKQILTGNTFHYLDIERQERLEEFASAFLDVSIFDLAEVWAPTGQNSDFLGLNSSIKCLDKNASLNKFTRESEKCRIKFWSGAVGRAFSSGNPVWSYNKEAFSDSVRRHLLQEANVETVLAVPVFSGRSKSPAFVFCCYSFVRSGSVPFVLKFVQQALQLLWGGLDNVQPHRSAGEDIWKNVAPADLGEMAADVEMHEHFMFKKRPIGAISDYAESQDATNTWQESNGRTYNTMKAMVDTNPITQHLSTNVHSSERAHVFVQKFVDTSTQPPQQPQQEVLQQHQQQSEQNIRSYHTLVQEEHRHYYQQKNITTPVTSNPLPLSRPFALPREVIHPKSNKGASSTLHKTHTIYESQKGDSGIPMTFNSAQRQLFENNTKKSYSAHAKCLDSNGFSYSISSAQPKHQDPLPCPVYSVSIGETCILATPASSVEPTSTNLSNKFSRTNKLCHIQGCDDIALARRPYCARHKGNRTCEKEGCSKCAQGSTRFCIAHGGGRRCTFPGCDKGARDKFFCAAHGGGKRCKFEGCRKSAVGGSNLCTAHGGGRRCAVEGCDKSAQSSTKFCVKHGGGKKCSHLGCEKVSRGRTQFCAAHGGGVRCKLAGCNRVAIGKVQLCRAHGGGCRPKNTRGTFSNKKVVLPLVSSGFTEGTFCVPIIESTIDSQAYSVGTVDLANV